MKISAQVEKAYTQALATRLRAHSPYSRFKVGAALQIAGQQHAFCGCNIENASFGGTVCAERAAVFAAVTALGAPLKPEFLVIVTGEAKATVPCGLCLQVLAEFCSDDLDIYLGNESAILEQRKLKDFLPRAFRVFAAK